MFCKYIFTIIFLRFSLCNIIVFPFKYINELENNNKNSFLNHFIQKKFITELEIGTPFQKININLNTNDYRFYIANNICYNSSISFFNYSNSLSFKSGLPAVSPFDNLEDASLVEETISLYNNINLDKNITIDKFKFYFYKQYKFKENSDIFCGNIGLSINLEILDLDYYDEDYYLPSIFSSLKSNDIISKYSWTYEYIDNFKYINNISNINIVNKYDGLIIIGKYPHEYNPSIYSGHDLISIYSDKKNYKSLWNFNFDKIYYNSIIVKDNKNNNLNDENNIISMNDKQVTLLININYIISTKEFFESIQQNFFDIYINKNICQINTFKFEYNEYNIISCKKEYFTKDIIKTFPSIYFKHSEFNYTFSLTYDELFKEKDEEIYFLIYNHKSNSNLWKMGKLFLQKYHFSFNTDSNTIHFYSNYDKILSKRKNGSNTNTNEEEEVKNYENLKMILICIGLFIISIIIGIFIGKKIANLNKKKEAKELQDSLSYESQDENINNDNKNNILPID